MCQAGGADPQDIEPRGSFCCFIKYGQTIGNWEKFNLAFTLLYLGIALLRKDPESYLLYTTFSEPRYSARQDTTVATRPHIILVDDDDQLRALFARMFASQFPAARLSIAPDGAYALTLYKAEGADLILSDCEMPMMDGPTLAASLRAMSAAIPIVLMSSSAKYAEICRAVEATAFFEKFGALRQIVAAVQSLLAV